MELCSTFTVCNLAIKMILIHKQVLTAAKHGFKAHGIELNIWLVWYSKFKALIGGLSKDTAFFRQDLWKYNLRKYDNVIIFGVDQMVYFSIFNFNVLHLS